MQQDKTYYEVLNLSEDASAEELKQAYRSLIKEWHPDLNPDKADAVEVTQEIIEAYGVLSDPVKRSKYDEYLFMIRPKPKAAAESGEEGDDAQPVTAASDENEDTAQPAAAASEPGYIYMSFEEYAGNTAYGTYSAWQDAFSGKSHKFDEEGYKEYAKNKKSIFDKDVKLSEGFIVILILIPVCSILFLNRGLLFPGTENTGKIIMPLILAGGGILGAAFEIHKRNRVAREEREKRLGGIDSISEADKWFDVWLYPGMPVSDCRKAFFAFSVRADKHILSRFNMLSDEEKKEYADIIELLKECINYREKK